jgi:hypothetical protein
MVASRNKGFSKGDVWCNYAVLWHSKLCSKQVLYLSLKAEQSTHHVPENKVLIFFSLKNVPTDGKKA